MESAREGAQVRNNMPPFAAEDVHVDDSVERLSVDDMLKKWVGEFGRAQFLHFTLTSLAWTVEALQTLVMIFADKTPKWQCRHLSHPNALSAAAVPYLDDPFPSVFVKSEGGIQLSSATLCTPRSTICSMNRTLWEWTSSKSQSTVSEWDLICGDSYKVGLVQSAFFIGSLIGAGLFGNLSDSCLGRKGALAVTSASNAICGFLTATSPNYWIYLLLRAATGLSCGGLGLTSFVLATESVGPSRRSSVGLSCFYFYSLGIIILCGLAAVSPSWRYLYVITSCTSFMYCLFVLPFLSESPRWYLVQGRSTDALNILKSIALKNGKNIPEGVILANDQEYVEAGSLRSENRDNLELQQIASSDVSSRAPRASGTLLDVFQIQATRMRMIIMVFVWFSCAMVYYGISLNVGNLGTNLYLSVLLNAVAEIPAYAITAVLLNKVGRRLMLIYALLLSGISCLVGAIVSWDLSKHGHLSQPSISKWAVDARTERNFWALPHFGYGLSNANFDYGLAEGATSFRGSVNTDEKSNLRSRVQLACGSVGIFAMAGTYNLLYLYTSELFPTVVRNAALGLASQAGAIGAVIAPLVVLLAHIHPAFPFGIFGVAAVIGGLIAFQLPETLNRPLHETLEGMQRDEA